MTIRRPATTRCGRPGHSRRGSILLQVAFLLMALMGLLAVVVDMGIARATQNFMQASADTAALEGLRMRDVVLFDPAQSDLERRIQAGLAAALVFDDDLDLGTANAAYLLGAGPQVFTEVAPADPPAGGALTVDRPFRPVLQLNEAANLSHGDLVAGEFESIDPLNPGNPDWHTEGELYQRSDFRPAPAATSPGAPAFLVRLRRTRDAQGLDAAPGVSSNGPPLPFLFGLGASISAADASYDPRRDGITVRATAIADSRPVLAAGVMSSLSTGLVPVGQDGGTPTVTRVLAIEDGPWRTELAIGSTFLLRVTADGFVSGEPGGPTPSVTGVTLSAPRPVSVGDPALSPGPSGINVLSAPPAWLTGVAYVAVVDAPGTGNVVGFGAVDLESAAFGTDVGGAPYLILEGRKLPSRIAIENASASLALATDPNLLAPPAPGREPLLAAALAR